LVDLREKVCGDFAPIGKIATKKIRANSVSLVVNIEKYRVLLEIGFGTRLVISKAVNERIV
jgi:hypothetical protein